TFFKPSYLAVFSTRPARDAFYTLSLHDALPISRTVAALAAGDGGGAAADRPVDGFRRRLRHQHAGDAGLHAAACHPYPGGQRQRLPADPQGAEAEPAAG